MLESLRGPWAGARVLDLFAGSGALGLEALSRGAAAVDLVESDRGAARTISTNLVGVQRARGPGVAAVHREPVERWLSRPPPSVRPHYDVVFCDPPYVTSPDHVRSVLTALDAGGWLAADAVVVVERASRDPAWQWPESFEALRDRGYGEAHLWIAARRDDHEGAGSQ
jgi:16S rRNA (guanine966-N2)-methyltransferase